MYAQYQRPTTPERSPALYEQVADELQSVEQLEQAFLSRIQDIQTGIEALRAHADEATIPRFRVARLFRFVTQLFVANRSADTLEKRLIDVESEIGGELLTKPEGIQTQRFWYHGGEWFYEAVDALGPMYARYIVTEQGFSKIVNGQWAPLTSDEEAYLVAAIGIYDENIRQELYFRETILNQSDQSSATAD